MENLLLTSQGIPQEIKNEFINLLKKTLQQTSVAFITTAAYGEEKNPAWLNVYRKQLLDCGITNIEDIDIRGKTKDELSEKLTQKDIIFVNGGNTFYLLHWARESGFDEVVKSLLQKDKLYIGVSAGSYIVCPTIEQATWKNPDRNKIGLKNLRGLNIVPFLITAHYKTEYKSTIEEATKTTKYPVVALNDNQAVLVRADNYKIVGDNSKVFFNGFQENWRV